MADFKRERVLFHVVAQGSVEVEYEVGAETPEERFRRTFHRVSDVSYLLVKADDLDFIVTCSTEREPHEHRFLYCYDGRYRCGCGVVVREPEPYVPPSVTEIRTVHETGIFTDDSPGRMVKVERYDPPIDVTQDELDDEAMDREMERAREDEAQQFRDHPMGRD